MGANLWHKLTTYKVVIPSTAGGTSLVALVNAGATGTFSTDVGSAVVHTVWVQAGEATVGNIALGDTPAVSADGSADVGLVLLKGVLSEKFEWMDLNDLKLISVNGTDTAQIIVIQQHN